jgi:ABC-type multidrug transport system ATPase subunit
MDVLAVLRSASEVANRRIKELLEVVGMGDRINTKSSDLSTGSAPER